MNINILKNRQISKKAVVNVVMFIVLIYFIFHSIYGSRGILAYFKLHAELERTHKTLENLRAERLEVENKTKLLRPGSLDRDMLEEKVRNVLGLSNPNEKVVKTNNEENKN